MQADLLLKAVADRSRIKILSYLSGGPKFVEQIAMQLNIGVSTASFHLEKLKAAGLVCVKKEQYYKVYYLPENALDIKLSDLLSSVTESGCDEFEKTVKEEYCGEKVEKLPVQTKKREIVLREISVGLKKGKGYTERQINLHIADRYDDFVQARKDMLLYGIIEKRGELYYKK